MSDEMNTMPELTLLLRLAEGFQLHHQGGQSLAHLPQVLGG